ncbi:MAG: cation diffusion facilitator family transporter [Candidatus Hydrogenedentales bacterium]|jgi:cation diffusion facilitator family transporter
MPTEFQATNAVDASHETRKVTLWGLAINLVLSGLKFIVGLLASSQALVADGVHSLSDMATDVAVLIGLRYWSAPADEDHPHGHGRIEMLVSALIGLVLAGVAAGIIYRAILTLHSGAVVRPNWPAFAVAVLSIVTKETLYRVTIRVGARIRSSAVLANAWHHRSDAFSSVPVALAVLASHLHPEWIYLDPVAAIVVSVLLLHAAGKITWPALRQLVDVGASEAEVAMMRQIIETTEGVKSVHELRTRHIGSGLQLDAHVLVAPTLTVREGHAIATAVKQRLLNEKEEVVDVLVHIEPFEAPYWRDAGIEQSLED